MVYQRIPADDVDSSVLAEKITFRNGKQAKNRFLKAAMTEKISSWSIAPSRRGYPSERIINMYEKWGHGGFGIVLTGNVPVDPYHLESAGNSIICKENDSAELRELFCRWAKVTKSDGARAVMQISHAGRQTPISVYEKPFSASDVQLPGFGKPVPLTAEQIKKEVVDRFTYTARVAYETGFDGVQLHGAHGYLLSQFMSPTTNKRTDKYGGSAENRVRIVMEIFDSIRNEIPAETGFIVGIKMNSVEFQEQGLETDDAKIMCQMMDDKGFDFVEMSGGTYEKLAFHHQRDSTKKREAFFLEFTDKLKPIFKRTPVYVTGGFRTVKGMVEAVKSGSTDGIGLGRPATAEPDLPKKILSGTAKSAADSHFDPNDFGIAVMASNSQMALMGRRSLAELNNKVCEDIADFSKPEEAEEYKERAAKYAEEMKKTSEKNLPIFGVLEYSPRY